MMKKIIATLGVFDGVHLGHKKILKEVVKLTKKNKGESLAITFKTHPERVISPFTSPLLLSTSEEKIRLIKMHGIDKVTVIDFTASFSKISAFNFVKKYLVKKFNVSKIIIGDNFLFGKDKEGDINFLKDLGKKFGFKVKVVKPVKFKGKVISSTRIRKALQSDNLEFVNKMLGRNYSINGIVIKGSKIGKKLGFPTANIVPFHEAIPANGVYAVKVKIRSKTYLGMCNIGFKPTFTGETVDKGTVPEWGLSPNTEVHIFEFNKNIYGSEIKIEFLKRIRDEKKFHNTYELINQLKKDKKKLLSLYKIINIV